MLFSSINRDFKYIMYMSIYIQSIFLLIFAVIKNILASTSLMYCFFSSVLNFLIDFED